MQVRDAAILAFLKSRPSAESLVAARGVLATFAQVLADCADPDVQTLVRHRLVASNSLLKKQQERARWDEANGFIAGEIASGLSPSLAGLCALNHNVTDSQAGLRSIALYGCNDEYLSAASLPAAVVILEETILTEKDPLLKAALVYIWVINAHPFENGNGRTGRLACDWILMSEGLSPLCFQSNVQGHVAYGQADRFPSMESCILKCFAAIARGYEILLGGAACPRAIGRISS